MKSVVLDVVGKESGLDVPFDISRCAEDCAGKVVTMRFQTDVFAEEVPGHIAQMMQINGTDAWVKRLQWLEREASENPYMNDWLVDRFGIEFALRNVLDGGVPALDAWHDGLYQLAAFSTGVTSLHDQLSTGGRKRLTGQLSDGLKSDSGLLSLQLEVSTINHLVRAGYDVQANDLEHGGGFDFLASKDGLDVEVECKLVSADIGRKIHRRHSAKLFHLLTPALEQTFAAGICGLVVQITLPDRLTAAPRQHEAIVRAVRAGFLAGTTDNQACTVRLHDFQIEASPFAAERDARQHVNEVRKLVARITGRSNSTLMMMVSQGERALVVSLESARPDGVLLGIRRQLRDAAEGQLTGERPGCLVAELHDLEDSQMLSLIKSDSPQRERATGLQIMTSDLLQSNSRRHVHSIVYRARTRVDDGQNFAQGTGYTYVVKNEWHPLANDARSSLFGGVKISSGIIV